MIATWRRHQSRKLARRGEVAMECGDWTQAQKLFATAFRLRPDRYELQTQLAHALKEAGHVETAVQQYEQAAVRDDDALYHLCVLYAERGEREHAGACLAALLNRRPDFAGAYSAMTTFGLESGLPSALKNRLRSDMEEKMVSMIDRLESLIAQTRSLMVETVDAYDTIRPSCIPAPPPGSGNPRLHVVVDARKSEPYHVRTTLFSLIGSDYQNWSASIILDDPGFDHAVMSMFDLDSRFRAHTPDTWDPDAAAIGVLYTSAGISLDRHALAWFAHVWENYAISVWTCDWDHKTPVWDKPPHYARPVLNGAFDLDLLLADEMPPPLLGIRHFAQSATYVMSATERKRRLALLAMDGEHIAHIPLPLASVTRIPERSDQAREKGETLSTWPLEWEGSARLPSVDGTLTISRRNGRPALTCGPMPVETDDIRIIIPTRDCADLLKAMVDSLLEHADYPDQVRIMIVDNRSQDIETEALLTLLQESGKASILRHDAAFNWAHMNNLAVQASHEPLLVFANNDMRMLSPGWDSRLRGQLNRKDVGIVGARLLFPDGGLQHAGMMLGLAEGSPVHLGVHGVDAGAAQDPIYDRTRSVASITGAFMGITRQWFERLGGFDAVRFPIAYNDVDLCLSSRMQGRKILFDPGIELLHFESRTRGLNDSRAKIAWDQGELGLLFAKWGRFSTQDPFISPLRSRPSLRGLAPTTAHQIEQHIEVANAGFAKGI
ncbi:glycosyltransferase [Sphingobium sp. MP9-4]|uniref:glycosyltransferase n=1 Tax=Sphingobium sp. MP9-4 TaxID=1761936 RepID=UPI0010CA7017|nr:glycosyltransferase [Sphingobium sp. MP9-4]